MEISGSNGAMKISKWVEWEQEIEIEIGITDARVLLSESFASDPRETMAGILHNVNISAQYFQAIGNAQIAAMTDKQREVIGKFLAEQSARFLAPNTEKAA